MRDRRILEVTASEHEGRGASAGRDEAWDPTLVTDRLSCRVERGRAEEGRQIVTSVITWGKRLRLRALLEYYATTQEALAADLVFRYSARMKKKKRIPPLSNRAGGTG